MSDRADSGSGPAESTQSEPGVRWRVFYEQARARFEAAGQRLGEFSAVDARRIVEQASGCEPGEFATTLDEFAPKRGVAHFDSMVERRLAGEPLQYVLGRWGFRSLDLAVDSRVLIPRPETEGVVQVALDLLVDHDGHGGPPLVVDLGTGSGCIGLSIVAEHPTARVICTDRSEDAVAAARANAAGLGRPAARLEIRSGDWFDALPNQIRDQVDVIVSNPPYVAADDPLPPVVADWEPTMALIAGPTWLEAAEVLIDGALGWLKPGGTLVVELGETQLGEAREIATAAGYADVWVHTDLAGRDRAIVARRPGPGGPEASGEGPSS